MSDLASLLSVAPNSAAFMMGQQNNADLQGKDADRQRLMQLIQGLQQEQAQKAQMQPLMMEHQSLQNQGLQAGLPGIQGDSALKQANGAVAQGTVQSGIAAGNAKNDLTSTNDRAAIQQKLGDMYRELGIQSESVPPAARKGFVINGLKAAGMDPNSPSAAGLMQGLQNTPAEQLPEELRKLSLKINANRDPNYAQADMTSQRQQESSKYTADQRLKGEQGNNATTLKAEQMRIDAGKYDKKNAATTMETALMKAKTAREKAEILESGYELALANNDPDTAVKLARRAGEARARAAEDASNMKVAPTQIDVGKVANLEQNPPATANAPIAGSGGAKAPAGINSLADLRKLSPAYAGMPDATLRQIYKTKYGVDLK